MNFLMGYGQDLQDKVQALLQRDQLGAMLLKRYPRAHDVRTDRALYDYVVELKNDFIRNGAPISKVAFDSKIQVIAHALGQHTYVSRVQGGKLKAKHEIRIATVFRCTPPEFLKMIVVHELAHLKEKDHNKAFYNLCERMEPAYHQHEFDLRVYLTHLEHTGRPLWDAKAG
jgi:predicted metal-dependent hydrolase